MTKFVAWYRGPRQHDAVSYIREYPAGNFFQESWPAGRESVANIADATRYDTYEEARAVVPVYDGSGGIEDRAGVIEVLAPGEAPPRDPWNVPVLVFAALVAAYFFWQFFIR